jgi:hypothetical protein
MYHARQRPEGRLRGDNRMGNVVDMKGQPTKFEENLELVVDCCRYAEGILTEAQVRKKYHLFDEATWQRLGSDDKLVEAIENEKIRRIRSGASKREKAQLLVVRAPDVMNNILLDDNANARHRIDACKALDSLATGGPEAATAAAAERYTIVINLNGDVERYDKSITINADDVAPNDAAAAPTTIKPINYETNRPIGEKSAKETGRNATARAPATTKPINCKTSRRKVARTPEQIALESLLQFGA